MTKVNQEKIDTNGVVWPNLALLSMAVSGIREVTTAINNTITVFIISLFCLFVVFCIHFGLRVPYSLSPD